MFRFTIPVVMLLFICFASPSSSHYGSHYLSSSSCYFCCCCYCYYSPSSFFNLPLVNFTTRRLILVFLVIFCSYSCRVSHCYSSSKCSWFSCAPATPLRRNFLWHCCTLYCFSRTHKDRCIYVYVFLSARNRAKPNCLCCSFRRAVARLTVGFLGPPSPVEYAAGKWCRLFIHLSICPSNHYIVCLSIYVFIYLLVCLSIYLYL